MKNHPFTVVRKRVIGISIIRKLLFPVVPDVLDIVVIFHDVDELFHQLDMLFALQLLIVLGDHLGKTQENEGEKFEI